MSKSNLVQLNYKTLNISIIFMLLIFCDNVWSQTGWYQVNIGTTQNLYDCQFINSSTGFIVGGVNATSGIILKTTNGGLNWQNILNTSYGLQGIFFIDNQTGWASPFGGPIKKTTNSGVTWSDQSNPLSNSYYLRKIQFVDQNTGWMAGGSQSGFPSGAVIYTSDGGNNWMTRLNASENLFFGLQFFNTNTGFVSGNGFDKLMKTTNAGLNWSTILNAPISYSLYFLDQVTGLVGSDLGAIFKSTNGGANWSYYTSGFGSTLYSVYAIDIINYITVGTNGVILRSTNSGSNWVQQTSGVNNILNKVTFLNSDTGWIVGDTGTVLRTTTGGFTFLEPISSNIPKNYSLLQNYPNPFNPSTKIKFAIPKKTFVQLKVFDILGNEKEILFNQELSPSEYIVTFDGSNYASGVYFYVVQAGDYIDSKKMVLVK